MDVMYINMYLYGQRFQGRMAPQPKFDLHITEHDVKAEYRHIDLTITVQDYQYLKENKISASKLLREAIKQLREAH